MKKFIIFFYVAVSLLVMPLHCSAETYYKLPEETYLETMKFIENSLSINQKLQDKISKLKQQQKELEEQIKILEQQQKTLKNSYESNNNILSKQNEDLKKQSELMKKKNSRLKKENQVLYVIVGGFLASKIL